MWERLGYIYDRLTERQRLAIGCVGVIVVIVVGWGVVAGLVWVATAN